MLQIATGKLFTRSPSRENKLRGILYSNAYIGREEPVQTATGALIPVSDLLARPQVFIYEFVERIEEDLSGPPTLVSSGAEPYVLDYSAVISFALNCVCSPDIDLVRRLISGQKGSAARSSPRALVTRFFDENIVCTADEMNTLVEFTRMLVGLPRATFLGVMKAIRTYVNGMHRIAENVDLAYTLLVASVESLAQDFDQHRSNWASVDPAKRRAIDDALAGVDDATQTAVQAAILKFEHVALARRFREFSISHTAKDYFKKSGVTDGRRLVRSELQEVLSSAYKSRSGYVHQLKRLPDVVTLGHRKSETEFDDRTLHLTLHGLSRLMRSVIMEFVVRQPQVEKEIHNYSRERSGVVVMRWHPKYWVGQVTSNCSLEGRDKLEGFLDELAPALLHEDKEPISDMRPVLAEVADQLPSLERRLRRPYLALFAIFNCYSGAEGAAPITPTIEKLIETELDEPCTEALLAYALCSQNVPWSLDVHRDALEMYFSRRAAPSGLRVHRLFEAAMTLDLAEHCRTSGDSEGCRSYVERAFENYPNHSGPSDLEALLDLTQPIDWHVLLPSREGAAESP